MQFGGYIFLGIFKHLCLKIAVHREEDFSTWEAANLHRIIYGEDSRVHCLLACEYIREAFTAIPMVVNDSLKVKCSKNKRSCRKVTRRRRAIKCQIALWKAFGVCVIFICSFWFLPWWLLDYVFHTVGKYEKNVTLQLKNHEQS